MGFIGEINIYSAKRRNRSTYFIVEQKNNVQVGSDISQQSEKI